MKSAGWWFDSTRRYQADKSFIINYRPRYCDSTRRPDSSPFFSQAVFKYPGSNGLTGLRFKWKAEGDLSLTGISVSAFQLVRVPRVWDDPGRREAEKGNGKELARLAGRFKEALDEWINSVSELGNWIRYTPPPPEAKRIEPGFEGEGEEEGGPETIH